MTRDEKSVSRRDLVRNLGAGAAALGASSVLAACSKKEVQPSAESKSAAPAAGEKHVWKMVTTWPKNFPGLGTGANRLAEIISEMSGGRLSVKVYGAGELVPAFGIFDAVSRGTAQMGHGAAYYWKGKHEASQFFSAVPFGLNAHEMNAWLAYGGGQELWDELYAGFGLKPFAAGNTGVQMGGWFNKEIKSVEDYEGLKMRIPGLGGEVLSRLGATVVNVPGGEIFQALKTGAIDASEWVGPDNDLAFGFHKAAKYYYWPGWHEPGTTLECFVNKQAYEALPSDLQAIVKHACASENGDLMSELTARNATALTQLREEHHVELREYSDEVLKRVGEVARSVVEDLAKKDPVSQKVYQSFDSFRRQAIENTRVSEDGYSRARALTFS
jgi:TRAP-type mannitol/chloroaromatic compound transport system substrate-binding protein